MKILVLLGGKSNEREVSFRSGENISSALRAAGFDVYDYDPTQGYDGLKNYVGVVDCVFPILHGAGGEDGEIQHELEKLGFKYLGSDSEVSAACFNKARFKELLNKLSILTPGWEVVDKESFGLSDISKNKYVLKPIGGGSTLDTFIVRDGSPIDLEVFDKYGQMLLEELIEGTEITVPVLDKSALPVIEIIPPKGKEFDYENKYNGATQELCPPLHVPADLQAKAQKLSEQIHDQVGAQHLSRVDIMIDMSGNLYVLEINTIPGLTSQSLFPKSAAVAGLSMPQLVQHFVKLVTE